jgi:anthranilate phosphoribosyltransferase
VALNAAAALVVGDVAADLAEGVEAAQSSIEDGRAAAALDAFVRVSVAAREAEAE